MNMRARTSWGESARAARIGIDADLAFTIGRTTEGLIPDRQIGDPHTGKIGERPYRNHHIADAGMPE